MTAETSSNKGARCSLNGRTSISPQRHDLEVGDPRHVVRVEARVLQPCLVRRQADRPEHAREREDRPPRGRTTSLGRDGWAHSDRFLDWVRGGMHGAAIPIRTRRFFFHRSGIAGTSPNYTKTVREPGGRCACRPSQKMGILVNPPVVPTADSRHQSGHGRPGGVW